MLNADSESEQPEADDAAVERIVKTGGRGALALVAILATAIVIGLWLALLSAGILATHSPMSTVATPDRTGSHDAAARAERRWSSPPSA